MITNPTVLVLGAGASADYGFPLGYTLVVQICAGLSSVDSNLYKQLLSCGFTTDEIEGFRRAFELSAQLSIDTFLERRPEFLEIGKATIACCLIPHEDETRFYRRDRRGGSYRWYEYLFSRMTATKEDFSGNQLSILTFNYDRSFEHFLYLALKNSYGLADDEAAKLLQSIPIVHLYGKLGELPYLSSGSGRHYRQQISREIIQLCIKAIKIVHEGAENAEEFKTACELLGKVKTICFLGFGYHPDNVRRLRLNELNQSPQIIGTAYELTQAEISGITQLFPGGNISCGDPKFTILDFLRQWTVLR